MSSGAVSDGACPHRMRDNHTQSEITRTSARTMSVCQVVTETGAGLMWQADKAAVTGTAKAAGRRLSESRMRENLTYGSRWQGMETRI
jgi:hypothetical protein